ncbi:hypothetical protein V5O48_015180 [Marasmius crinis-equi]|uniref:Uncharacterized protein n=1 Tax=Marasmius crinis-equi TaxID=585013 RepID=A0ABR3EV98_9AGAR
MRDMNNCPQTLNPLPLAFSAATIPSQGRLLGARTASEAASSKPKIDSALLKLFKNSCIQRDLAWYVENGVVSWKQVFDEAILLNTLLPNLDTLLAATGVEPYIHAKIFI